MVCQNRVPFSVTVLSIGRNGTASQILSPLCCAATCACFAGFIRIASQPAISALTSIQPSAVPAKDLRCPQVKPDLSNFDESQAWPVLLDNFVDWARGHSAAENADQ